MLIFQGSSGQSGTEGRYGMGSARVSLKRSKTGVWRGRKEIPEGIRAAYGKREEKASWPAHLTYEQALSEYLPWRAKIEADIDLHKKKAAGVGLLRLTRQQAKALAADWYRAAARDDDEVDAWHGLVVPEDLASSTLGAVADNRRAELARGRHAETGCG